MATSVGNLASPLLPDSVARHHRAADGYIMKRLIGLTGVESFLPHDLRESFISKLLNNGEEIKTIANIVGHAVVCTAAGYCRRDEQRKKFLIGP